MAPVHREVHDDEIVLSHDSLNRRRRVVEVVIDRRQGLPQAFAPLRPGRVLDEVLRDETECGTVSTFHGLLEGQHGLYGRHRVITHVAGPGRAESTAAPGRDGGQAPSAASGGRP